ncbi:MAG: elongation factor EF-2 [Candidatus Diapherotrites archaeon]|nr:elongation factor EF-2 [Candidatus Diapherotrites archaeon]
MAKREEMVKIAEKLMNTRANIRNIGTVAHIDHGKCVAPHSRVQLADGRVLSAEQLYAESVLSGEKVRETKSETIFALKKPITVFSVNRNTGKIEKKCISHAWKLRGGKTLRVSLRNGNTISTTPEHKYLVFDGIKFGFKEAKELRIGERITVARKLSCESGINIEAEALRLLAQKRFYVFLDKQSREALKLKILEKGLPFFCAATKREIKKSTFTHCLNKGRYLLSDFVSLCTCIGFGLEEASGWIERIGLKDSVKMRWPVNWREMFHLAGLMIGDGSYNRFVVGKPALRKRFEGICLQLGFVPIERNYPPKTFEYQTNTTLLHVLNALFDYPLRKKSRNVRISSFAKQAPDGLLAEMLKAYFDCDGTVEKSRSAVSISTASTQMMQDLQLALPRFGCMPVVGKKNTVYIAGNNVQNFIQNIGFSLEEKMHKAEALGAASVGSVVCDTVPCSGFRKIREATGKSKESISHHYYKYENLVYAPQRNTYAQIMATLVKEAAISVPCIDELAFIEIKGITEEHEETVYDFSVPENQNFVAEGIVIHNTTLSDNLIAAAGLMSNELAGKQLVMDFYELEQQRGITINAANISLVHTIGGQEYLINLIDTPGHIDFGGEVIRAMRAVDGVILVVDSVEGVMPQTETVIRQALKERVRPVLFINKVDRLVNELQLNAEQMQERFVKTIAHVNKLIKANAPKEFSEKWQVKVQEGSVSFGSAYHKWAVDVYSMKETNIGFKDIFEYCKNGDQKTLAKRSPLHATVLGMVVKHLPSPIQAQRYRTAAIWSGDPESEVGKAMLTCDEKGPFSMMVTDVTVDPHAGDIATGRIYSGTIRGSMKVRLMGMQKEIGIQQVVIFMGPERVKVEQVPAGNIAGLIGLKEAYAGETISSIEMKPFESFKSTAEPVITISIEPKHTKDLPKLIETIRQITKEDPNVVASLNQETGEHLISGMGELHLEVTRYRIEVDHKIAIDVSNPIVVYREMINKKSPVLEGKSPNKHNKFKMAAEAIPKEVLEKLVEAKINGKIKPKDKEMIAKFDEMGFDKETARGIWAVHNNCVLVDATRGIVALHEIRELVMQGFQDAMNEGPLAKEKCMGVMITLHDAKLHEDAIHRGPAQVLPAITRTCYACMLSADPVILEPKQTLFITVPNDYMGAVSKELGSRRTQISEMRQEGDATIFIAKAPVKELIGFSADIRGATQGRAVWTAEYAGYEQLPREMQRTVIAEVRKRKGLDPEPKSAEFFLD